MAYLSALHPLDKLLLRMIAYDTVLGAIIAEIIFVTSFFSNLEIWSRYWNPFADFILWMWVSLFAGAVVGCFVGMINGFFTGIATHFCMKYANIPYYRRVVMVIAIIFTSPFLLPIIILGSWQYPNQLVFDPAVLIGSVIIIGIAVYASQRVATLYLCEVDLRKGKVKVGHRHAK